MAIIVKEQGHLATSNAGFDESTTVRVFYVRSDDETPLRPYLVENAAGIPAIGAAHPDFDKRLLKNKRVHAHAGSETRFEWVVECNYSDKQDYTFLTDRISWGGSTGTELYFVDRSPTPLRAANSAGEQLEPLPERITVSHEATVERRVSSFTPAAYLPYGGAVNSDSFTLDGETIGPRGAFMMPIECGPYTDGEGGRRRDVRFRIALAPTFDQVFADRGFNELSAGKLVQIMKKTPPVRVDKPWPLNGSGGAKANATDAPAELTLWPYRQLPFAGFGFS